mgnify:CR=1 FL=1
MLSKENFYKEKKTSGLVLTNNFIDIFALLLHLFSGRLFENIKCVSHTHNVIRSLFMSELCLNVNLPHYHYHYPEKKKLKIKDFLTKKKQIWNSR